MTQNRILLAHGSGGQLSHELVRRLFLKYFDNPILARLDDAAVVGGSSFRLEVPGSFNPETSNPKLAFTTDSYVVNPIFFPGGDIGKLAVCGTVNDLAMSGARPLYLSAAFIIEEGLSLDDLKRIVVSMRQTADEAGVDIITGDTKVVSKGSADGLFINTTGVGIVPERIEISGSNARPGDKVIVSGTIGDHGVAIMSQREGLEFSAPLRSDCAPLNRLVAAMLEASKQIHCLRDPTRGGLATTLSEFAAQSDVGILIHEDRIPIRDAVRGACEMLGLEPLHVANEGKLVAVVDEADAEKVLACMRGHLYGTEAAIIGEVRAEHPGRVVMRTPLGTSRLVDMLVGDLLPRIC
jgi:hydrogenase expression/formation protein HypE